VREIEAALDAELREIRVDSRALVAPPESGA
jgi:hypothetical protein